MAWIELHQSLWTHKKTFLLAAELDIDEIYAAAHMAHLWCWALDNVADGELDGLPFRVIAFGAGWKGNADIFVEALISSGWVDRDGDSLTLHDWHDYAGRLIEKRTSNAQRMREARANKQRGTEEERAENVQETCDARAGATVPNSTVPNRTKKEKDPVAVAPVRERKRTIVDEYHDRWLERYQVKPRIPAKDAKLLNDLVKSQGMDTVIHCLDAYFADGDPFVVKQKHAVGYFSSNFNRWLVDAMSEQSEVAATSEKPRMTRKERLKWFSETGVYLTESDIVLVDDDGMVMDSG